MPRVHDHTFAPAPGDQGHVLTIKNLAQELLDAIGKGFDARATINGDQERCRALAKTSLEISIMWAARGLREGNEPRV